MLAAVLAVGMPVAGMSPGAAAPTPGTAAAGPALTVAPTTGLDPGGAAIRVTGTGFDTAKQLFGSPRGIYLAFGVLTLGADGRPTNPDWYTDATSYQAAVYVYPRPPGGVDTPTTKTMETDPANPDGRTNGRFDFELTRADGSPITARWTAGGQTYDCTAPGVTCYVLTFAAKGDTDRSQDLFVPVRFASGDPDPDPDPAHGTATQVIRVGVNAGPLTLSSAGEEVVLPDVQLRDTEQETSAPLNEVTVGDYRAESPGWTLVGQVSDFRSGDDRIAAANLGWVPAARSTASALVSGAATPVEAGPPAPPGQGLDRPRVLCRAGVGAGGSWVCGALLTLGVPGATRPGTYRALLTLTLS